MTEAWLEIDGAFGEGGGQIVRTSISLSAVTGRPVHIKNVRGGRKKPGLLRQHATAIRTAATICDAEVNGGEVGSRELRFRPGSISDGTFDAAVGSAGSATLVLQTALPILAHAPGQSVLRVSGGTHNPMAPPFEFLTDTMMPAARHLGWDVTASLDAHGFYPGGGGAITMTVDRGASAPLDWTERGAITRRRAVAIVSDLPGIIGKRELDRLGRLIRLDSGRIHQVASPRGPGNALVLQVDCAPGETGPPRVATFTALGRRGLRAEAVAEQLARDVQAWEDSCAPVGAHLADQLLLPMALGPGGRFRTTEPTLHTTTNAAVIERFTGRRILSEQVSDDQWEIRVSSA